MLIVSLAGNNTTGKEGPTVTNPLVQRLQWQYEVYKRIKLLPWWLKYNIGVAEARSPEEKDIRIDFRYRISGQMDCSIDTTCSIGIFKKGTRCGLLWLSQHST